LPFSKNATVASVMLAAWVNRVVQNLVNVVFRTKVSKKSAK